MVDKLYRIEWRPVSTPESPWIQDPKMKFKSVEGAMKKFQEQLVDTFRSGAGSFTELRLVSPTGQVIREHKPTKR